MPLPVAIEQSTTLLKQTHCRITPQRVAILDVLHVTAQGLCSRCRAAVVEDAFSLA